MYTVITNPLSSYSRSTFCMNSNKQLSLQCFKYCDDSYSLYMKKGNAAYEKGKCFVGQLIFPLSSNIFITYANCQYHLQLIFYSEHFTSRLCE